MNVGMLLLRLMLGTLIAGHALQKLLGLFGGHGISGTAKLFESWNLRPGPVMVVLAGCSELIGALLVASGTLTAVGVALVIATMLVAISACVPNGFWALSQGYELPMVYALTALCVGLIGPGRLSVDHAIGLMRFTTTSYVLPLAGAAVVCAAPLILRVTGSHRTASPTPGNADLGHAMRPAGTQRPAPRGGQVVRPARARSYAAAWQQPQDRSPNGDHE